MTGGGDRGALLDALRRQDAAVARSGLAVWIGAEPTFTRADSQEVAWLFAAEGDDKEARARDLLRALAPRLGAGEVRLVRALGRQYPEEPAPRFAYGASWQRGGAESGTPAVIDELDGLAVEAPASQDRAQAWLTVTPDPAVVEVNLAPAPDLVTFLAFTEATYAAARDAGLSPLRYRYNGQLAESGGGGQITLGGPSPDESPFLLAPRILPGLLRLFNRHPCLSYLFAPECLGSASQGPRPDEGVRERFDELPVALEILEGRADVPPEELWSALAPLLVDASGNSHRAELNVEKLWNPYLEGRGKLGLLEFRSLGMPPRPERLVAVAALLRALVLRAATEPVRSPLVDWGPALHDRFALPAVLLDDLEEVFADLRAHDLSLGEPLESILGERPEPIVRVDFRGATLTVSPAREFWPLVGDVASQERSGSRLVDSSTERVELLVECHDGCPPGRVSALGREVPLHALAARGGTRHVAGIRTRAFVPSPGFHPSLPPTDPVTLVWERGDERVSVGLHRWIPGGGAYPGLPWDAEEARRRRTERVVVRFDGPPVEARPSTERGERVTVDLRGTRLTAG